MEIIVGGRQSGRTTRLIELAAAEEAAGRICYIVCAYHAEAYRIAKQAEAMNLSIGFPIMYTEFLDKQYYGQNIDCFLIDNADDLLQALTPVGIKAIVVSS